MDSWVPWSICQCCTPFGSCDSGHRDTFDRPDAAIGVLDELPELNLLVAKYLVKFLQLIGDPRYQPVTKMNISNLAMVFAPSFLRCPSDNPLTILANSRLEQAYLKTLINYLEE